MSNEWDTTWDTNEGATNWDAAPTETNNMWDTPTPDTNTTWEPVGETTNNTWGGEGQALVQDTTWGVTGQETTWGAEPNTEWEETTPVTTTPEDEDDIISWDYENPVEDYYQPEPAPPTWDAPSPLPFPLTSEEPTPEETGNKKPVPKWAIITGAVTIFLTAAGGSIFMLTNNDKADTPEQQAGIQLSTLQPAPPAEATTSTNLKEMDDFTDLLSTALTNHDVDAYYTLLSSQAKQNNQKSVAEAAIKTLPAGASYKVTAKSVQVAGATAAATLEIEQHHKGTITKSETEVELVMENGLWKMVAEPASTN